MNYDATCVLTYPSSPQAWTLAAFGGGGCGRLLHLVVVGVDACCIWCV
jgi:hypothetical protein